MPPTPMGCFRRDPGYFLRRRLLARHLKQAVPQQFLHPQLPDDLRKDGLCLLHRLDVFSLRRACYCPCDGMSSSAHTPMWSEGQ